MAINYTVDVVAALFNSDVASETAYQIPGDFGLPTSFGKLSLATVAIAAAGTGYSANDVVTLSGGTSTSAATVKVLTAPGGIPATIEIVSAGVYTTAPTSPVSTTGGGGSGLTITATWNGYPAQRLLTMVEMMRSYMAQMGSVHEAKLLFEVTNRMMAAMRFGHTWDTTNVPTKAQEDAMNFIANIPNLQTT